MPKLFSIKIQVEEIALGRVMHALNVMPGVANLHLDLEETKVRPGRANGAPHGSAGKPRKSYEITGTDFMLQLLHKNKKPMTTGQLKQAFAEAGRSSSSIASPMYALRKNGDIGISSEGYSLTKKARDRLNKRKGA